MAEIEIEIAYASAEKQKLYLMKVQEGTTVREAVDDLDLKVDFPQADTENTVLGIFGKVVKEDTVLRAGDRIEIYRPLVADPKEARRKRVAQKKEEKQ